MPRLVTSEVLRQIAILYLLELYKQETGFVAEWKHLRHSSISLLAQIAKVDALAQVNWMIFDLPLFEGELALQRLENYLVDFAPPLKNARDRQELEHQYDQILEKLEPYKNELADLACRWNLRAPWAADELLSEDIDDVTEDMFKAAGVAGIIKQGQEQLKGWLSMFPPFLPPLTIQVPWASFLTGGRRKILTELRDKLVLYEKRLKLGGAREFPSSLKAHAKWWFQHHVCHETYDEIAQLEVYTAGGKLVSYAKNVGAAVRKFSRLIGINPKNLK